MSERSFRRAGSRRRQAEARRRRRKAALAVSGGIAAGAFTLAPGAEAANYEVTSLADGPLTACDATCTLREAIATSNNNGINDVITFQSNLSGTIRLNQGPLHPIGAESIEIRGPGGGQIIVSGDTNSSGAANPGDTRIFITTATTNMSGLTLEDGYAGDGPGGAIRSVGILTLSDMVIRDSIAADPPALTAGGGLSAEGMSTVVTGSTFDNNEGLNGGGIHATRKLTLQDSTFVGNEAYYDGGAIFMDSKYAQAEISNATITGNTAKDGGGISISIDPPVYGQSDPNIDTVIRRSTISNNDSYIGGGINFDNVGSNAEVRVEQSTISGNDSNLGGGVGSSVTDKLNKVRFVNSTLSGNYAAFSGGGAAIGKATDFDFDNSTISGNTAHQRGGGIALLLYASPAPPNSARTATVGLASTIVGFNFAPGGTPNDLHHDAASTAGGFDTSFSLIQAPGSVSMSQAPAGSTQLGVDPQLGILTENGGPTLTHGLQPTSPAIDRGIAAGSSVDQRGRTRTTDRTAPNAADGTDIGAVEEASDIVPTIPPPIQAAIPPNTKITNKPDEKQKTASARKVIKNVQFTSDTAGSRFECKVNGGPFSPCTSPLQLTLAAAPGKGRFHLIQIRAIGPFGAVEEQPASFGVRIRQLKKK